MKLEKPDIDQIAKWLNDNWVGKKLCPCCSVNDWTISDTVFEFRAFHGGGLVVGGSVYPAVGIVCNICGYTLFYNAIKIGIVKPEPLQKKPEPLQKEKGSNNE